MFFPDELKHLKAGDKNLLLQLTKYQRRSNRFKDPKKLTGLTVMLGIWLAILVVSLVSCKKEEPTTEPYTPIDSVINSSTSTNPVLTQSVQYNGDFVNTKLQVQEFDLWNYSKEEIAEAKKTSIVICYFSSNYEGWRPDASKFKADDLGKKLDKWDNEKWSNSESPNVRQIMVDRMKEAKEKGCDGINPDNVDQYQYGTKTGFSPTLQTMVDYVLFMCNEAKKLDLKYVLKNAPELLPYVKDCIYGAQTESCNRYNECDKWKDIGKPVFNIEYRSCKKYDYMFSVRKSSMNGNYTICK